MRGFHVNWTRPFFGACARPALRGRAVRAADHRALRALLAAGKRRHLHGLRQPGGGILRLARLDFLQWDEGIFPLLDRIPDDINARAFWAAGKLYAAAAMKSPCVMLDTDLICWKNLDALLADRTPPPSTARTSCRPFTPAKARFPARAALISMNSTGRYRRSTPRCAAFGSDEFRRYYTDTAIRFMRSTPQADDTLTHGVRRAASLAMRRKKKGSASGRFPTCPRCSAAVRADISHIWGFKRRCAKKSGALRGFCRRCAARLSRDFPGEAEKIARVPVLGVFFERSAAP